MYLQLVQHSCQVSLPYLGRSHGGPDEWLDAPVGNQKKELVNCRSFFRSLNLVPYGSYDIMELANPKWDPCLYLCGEDAYHQGH